VSKMLQTTTRKGPRISPGPDAQSAFCVLV
jgi:hypothetical protein